MRTQLLTTLFCSCLVGGISDAQAQDVPNGYALSWSDEFDTDGRPSPDNWSFENGFVRNRELQWYQQDNAFCEDGMLVIEARRERVEVPPPASPGQRPDWAAWRTHAEYTSASLKTRGKHAWRYGRFEMRAKIPAYAGAWPAFWTLGHGSWPACGEIDIMEYYDNSLLANVAWLGPGGRTAWRAAKEPLNRFGDATWADAFHVWRMDWDASSIRLYVDDLLVNATDTTNIRNANHDAANPFRKPHYVLVGLAIGGKHGGDPSPTEFPIRYEIDYIRIYKQARTTELASDPGEEKEAKSRKPSGWGPSR